MKPLLLFCALGLAVNAGEITAPANAPAFGSIVKTSDKPAYQKRPDERSTGEVKKLENYSITWTGNDSLLVVPRYLSLSCPGGRIRIDFKTGDVTYPSDLPSAAQTFWREAAKQYSTVREEMSRRDPHFLYTVQEVDQLRSAIHERVVLGSTYFPPPPLAKSTELINAKGNVIGFIVSGSVTTSSRSFFPGEENKIVEEQLRTHMQAGHKASDLEAEDKASDLEAEDKAKYEAWHKPNDSAPNRPAP